MRALQSNSKEKYAREEKEMELITTQKKPTDINYNGRNDTPFFLDLSN